MKFETTINHNNNFTNNNKKTVLPKIKVSSDEDSDEFEESDEVSEEESTSGEYSDTSTEESEEVDKDRKGRTKCINNNDDQYGDCCRHGLVKINQKPYVVVSNESPYAKIRRGKQSQGVVGVKTSKKSKEIIEKPKKRKRQPVSICILNSRYEIIGKVAKELGYRKVKEQDMWNLCWTDSIATVEFCREMRRFQKINHFPGMYEISRKDLLARNLNRMLKLFPTDYQIFPKTWCFPADYGEAMTYSRRFKNKTYILKPDHSSQGKGIWLTKNLKDVDPSERLICQIYLNKPLLIDGYKFDLRVYTLITSLEPLRIFVYNEGLARFATSKYREPSVVNTSNVYMHLTNYSVNKHSRMFSHDYESGSKRTFSTLNKILAAENYDVEALWAEIDDIIVKTVLSAWPMLKHNYNASFPNHDVVQACFELLGFDILIDHKMKPYILEVNHSPSFQCSQEIDKEVKEALIRDTLLLLNINNDVKRRVMEEDKKRVRSRLLQRIREHKDVLGDNAHKISKENNSNYINNDGCKMWAVQIEWEETNLAGFRRIMPAPGDPQRYAKFFFAQNQVSVYSETAASKRREECAKRQRLELEAKRKERMANMRGEDDDGKVTIRRRRILKPIVKNDGYQVEVIPEGEEKERISLLSQREFLIRSCGLIQMIYVSFYRNHLLSESDRRKYREAFAKVTALEPSPALQNLPLLPHKSKRLQLKSLLINDPGPWSMSALSSLPQPQLPCLNVESGGAYKNNRTAIARHLTNAMKKHSIEARQFFVEATK